MLTLEFRATLTSEQKKKIDFFLQQSKFVWNRGLAALEKLDTFSGYFGSFACPVQWQYRYVSINKDGAVTFSEKDTVEKIKVPYSPLIDDRSRWYIKDLQRTRIPTPAEMKDSWGWKDGYGYSCPIKRDLGDYCDIDQPIEGLLIARPQYQASGGLGKTIAKDFIPELIPTFDPVEGKAILKENPLFEMPYKFRAGVLAGLDTAWQEYIKSRQGQSKIQNGDGLVYPCLPC